MTELEEPVFRASVATEIHPRPRLQRRAWHELSGPWNFAYDDDDLGRAQRWHATGVSGATINVPFPPESPASGIGDTGFHPVVWYSRRLTADDLAAAKGDAGNPLLKLHFGAVDYHTTVWCDGSLLGEHEGGHTPFSFTLDRQVTAGALLVVRAEDQPGDVSQPRGKQDWLIEPHDIWYHRTTGIWQPVWLEGVPEVHIASLDLIPHAEAGGIDVDATLNRACPEGAQLSVRLSFDGSLVAEQVTSLGQSLGYRTTVHLREQLNGQHYDRLLWSPEQPRLIDVEVTITHDGAIVDRVWSYTGLRSVETRSGAFVLNARPYFIRGVLEQGFWPESHLAAPSAEALRDEVEVIKRCGFNTARIHQKIEDPRFLYWADRLGLLVWGEAPATYEYTSQAASRLTREWIEAVQRDLSHPCLVTWVPVNESWGVQHISSNAAQRAFTRGLADLTRALDPTRPVISNDGWEHTNSDILTIHDYDTNPESLAARYADGATPGSLAEGYGPAGRLVMAEGTPAADVPVMVSEFGGIRFTLGDAAASWGYTTAHSEQEFEKQLRATVRALRESPVLAGYCYTQLTDTMQEANGLLDERRQPKLPFEVLRDIFS